MAEVFTYNTGDAQAKIDAILKEIDSQQPMLMRSLAVALQKDTQQRIVSENDGKWAKASKWIQAKKNVTRVLEGAEKYVKIDVTKNSASVYGDTPDDWTLTMHHEGFINKPEASLDARIEIEIENPNPLNLRPGTTKFSWIPRDPTPHSTPARQIWPTEAQAVAIVQPMAARWLQAIVNLKTGSAPNA